MAYVKKDWKDRTVERPLTFILQDNGDGTHTLIPSEGSIIESGTPITADNLNHMEDGIANAVSKTGDTMIGALVMERNGGSPIILVQADYASGPYNYLAFADNNAVWQSYIGWSSARDGKFNIYNKLGNIKLTPVGTGALVEILSDLQIGESLYMSSDTVTLIREVLRYTPNDSNGGALTLGAGGTTIIGGGEAPFTIVNSFADYITNLGVEEAIVCADSHVRIITGMQTAANRKEFRFTNLGVLEAPSIDAGDLDVTGVFNRPMIYARYATNTAKSVTTNSYTRLTFQVANKDTHGMYVSGEDTFLIKEDGWYRFQVQGYATLTAGKTLYLQVWKTDGTKKHDLVSVVTNATTGSNAFNGEHIIQCTAGEKYELVCQQTTGATQNINGYQFSIFKL